LTTIDIAAVTPALRAPSFDVPQSRGTHPMEFLMSSKLRMALVAALLAIPVTSYAAQALSACGCGESCGCGAHCNCGK
jgi:hypothetical protein